MSSARIKLDEEGLTNLLREIYNDCSKQKKNIMLEMNKRSDKVEIETVSDAYQMGKVNNESLKLLDNVINNKMTIAKMKLEYLKSQNKGKVNEDEFNQFLNEEEKNFIEEYIKKTGK